MTAIPEAITAEAINPADLLVARAESIDLPVWVLDSLGTIIREPEMCPSGRVWTRSSLLTSLVRETAVDTDRATRSAVLEPSPGYRMIVVPLNNDESRPGARLVALALAPGTLDGEMFARVCASAAIDPDAARSVMRRYAVHDEEQAERLRKIFTWNAEDLRLQAAHETSLNVFTEQLTQSYESIHTLYTLGRLMGGLDDPRGFIETSLEMLVDTIECRWGMIRLEPGRMESHVPDRFAIGGIEPENELIVQAAADPAHGKVFPVSKLGIDPSMGPQAVIEPIIVAGASIGHIVVGGKTSLDPQISSYDTLMVESTASFLGSFVGNLSLLNRQKRTIAGTIQAMSAALDAKDSYTQGHSERVALMGAALARASGLDPQTSERVRLSGIVHDIGKIGVPEHVLTKPGRLTRDEFELIKAHPGIGARIIKDIPDMADLVGGVLSHHERYDGKGYPNGLEGEDIPLFGRILAIADTFDAMSSNRSYRSKMDRETVLQEIRDCAGTQFDPALAAIFVDLDFSEYDRLHRFHETIASQQSELRVRDAA